MTHNKNRNPLSYLLINCISTRSAPQILSLKDERSSSFSNFLKIGLYISSTHCWLSEITSEFCRIVNLIVENVILIKTEITINVEVGAKI